jgi:carbon-monoxide dehydrogenase small subunit
MVMAAYFLLLRNSNPSEAEIKHGIAGNLCRCTGYLPIVEAVTSAAQKLRSIKAAS